MKKYRMTMLSRNYDAVYSVVGTVEEIAAETYISIEIIKKAAKHKIWYMEYSDTFVEMRLIGEWLPMVSYLES